MAEHVFADPKRTTPVQQTHEVTEKQAAPRIVESGSLADLQRVLGNQGLQRMLAQRKIQAKLTVGAADDQYEQEADRVAKEVMSAAPTNENVQRDCEDCGDEIQRQDVPEEEELQLKRIDIQRAAPEEEELLQGKRDIQRQEDEDELQFKRVDIQRQEDEDELQFKRADIQRIGEEEDELMMKRAAIQRAEVDMSGSFDVDENVEGQINSAKGGGQSLPSGAQGFFESRFGQDFGDVRVHANSQADALNRSVGARAFTNGSDIFLRSNEYSPDSSSGRELLAHELTHVVQQTGGKPSAQAKRDEP